MHSDNRKVISIRKIDEINKKNESFQHKDIAEQQHMLQLSVDRLETELANLQLQKKKVLDDLKRAIDIEKANWLEQKEEEKQIAQKTGYKIGYDAAQEEVFTKH